MREYTGKWGQIEEISLSYPPGVRSWLRPWYSDIKAKSKIIVIPRGGGPLVFQTGYHPRKRTFKTHPKHVFFRYENRP